MTIYRQRHGVTGFSVADGHLVGTQSAPINPMLGPLASNGGLNQTIALLPGSPALGMGDPAADTGRLYHRRCAGFARVVSGVTDRGAVQTQITPLKVVPTPSVTAASTIENRQTTSGVGDHAQQLGTQYFQITNIAGGTLYLNDGATPINDGDFITLAQAAAGLKLTPTSVFAGRGQFRGSRNPPHRRLDGFGWFPHHRHDHRRL